MKTDKENQTPVYKLIPMSEIDDEAKAIAVAWVEQYGTMGFDIQNKHKLASDIMNYHLSKKKKEYASQSKQGWEIGKMVEVTKCIHGHEFQIGDTVIIVDYENTGAPDKWLCEKDRDRWYLSEEEGELIRTTTSPR